MLIEYAGDTKEEGGLTTDCYHTRYVQREEYRLDKEGKNMGK